METNPFAPPSFLDNLGETYSERNADRIPPDVARLIGETSKWIRVCAIIFRVWVVVLCGASLAMLGLSFSFAQDFGSVRMWLILGVLAVGAAFHYATRLLYKSSGRMRSAAENHLNSDLLGALKFHHTYWIFLLVYKELMILVELGQLYFGTGG